MTNTFFNLSLILACTTLSSCATRYYSPPEQGALATVSFSNLSPEIPKLYITSNCKSFLINQIFIEQKNPADKSKHEINIPANSEITFEYNYYWFSGEKTELVTNGIYYRIEETKSKIPESCTKTITFIPEDNKHYEVYFGINLDHCIIKAVETQQIQGSAKKKLLKINPIQKKRC